MKNDFNNWNAIDLSDRESRLPTKPGVYAVVDGSNGELCYIGKSKNLRERWKGDRHHRYPQASALGWPRLLYLEVPEYAIHGLETKLIQSYKTTWNNTAVPGAKPRVTAPDPAGFSLFEFIFTRPIAILLALFVIAMIVLGGDEKYATVNTPEGQWLLLKDEYGKVLYELPHSSTVKVLGPVESDGYMRVKTELGDIGYVSADYLAF